MSGLAVVVSGYLAAIASPHGTPAYEVQSRVDLGAAHVAETIDVTVDPTTWTGELRDLDAGGAWAVAPWLRLAVEGHVLTDATGTGGAIFVGTAARRGAWAANVAGAGLALGATRGTQLELRIARAIAARVRVAGGLIATGETRGPFARVAGTLGIEALVSTRVQLEALALIGTRAHALLGDGQVVESTHGSEGATVRAVAAVALGRGRVFAGLVVREPVADGGEVVALIGLAHAL